MTASVRPMLPIVACLFLAATGLAQIPKGNGKGINEPTYVLAHGNLRYDFTFAPVLADIHLQSLENVTSGQRFTFAEDPLWQVDWIDVSTGAITTVDANDTLGPCTITTSLSGSDLVGTLRWRQCPLGAERFEVTIDIRIPATGDHSYWRASVDGSAVLGHAIKETTIGVGPHKPTTGNSFAVMPSRGGLLVTNPATNLVGNGTLGFISNKLPFQLFPYYTDAGDGLYLATHDGQWDYKQLVYAADGERYWVGVEQFATDLVTVPSTYTSSYDLVVGTFSGDWFDAAQIYRTWSLGQSWMSAGPLVNRTDIPTWWKELELLSSHSFDSLANPATVAADYESVRLHYGIPADRMVVMQWSWFNGVGPYTAKPSFLSTIHQLRTKGVRSMPYFWSYAYDTLDPTYVTNNIAPLTKKDFFGQTTIDPFSAGSLAIADPSQAGWQSHMCSVIQALQPVDAVYLDNPYDTFPDYDASHGHSGYGTHMVNGFRQLFESLRSCLRTGNPDQVIGYEALFEGYIGTTEWIATPNTADGSRLTLASWARYVPLPEALFHDYIPMVFSNGKSDYLASIYVDADDLLFTAVDGFVNGKIVTAVEAEYLRGGPVNHLSSDPLVQIYVSLLQQMIDTRRNQAAFLTYGQFLRPMTTDASIVVRQFFNRQLDLYSVQTVDLPSASYRAPDGRVGIVIANPETSAQSLTYLFRFADGGLTVGQNYDLIDAETATVIRTVSNDFVEVAAMPALDIRFFILAPSP